MKVNISEGLGEFTNPSYNYCRPITCIAEVKEKLEECLSTFKYEFNNIETREKIKVIVCNILSEMKQLYEQEKESFVVNGKVKVANQLEPDVEVFPISDYISVKMELNDDAKAMLEKAGITEIDI